MQGIFNDEWHKPGSIWPNPQRDAAHLVTGRRCENLEVPALPHFPRLTSGQIGHADDTN